MRGTVPAALQQTTESSRASGEKAAGYEEKGGKETVGEGGSGAREAGGEGTCPAPSKDRAGSLSCEG